jgi:site-specific recombinase XerD
VQAACVDCGRVRRIAAFGHCPRCYERHRHGRPYGTHDSAAAGGVRHAVGWLQAQRANRVCDDCGRVGDHHAFGRCTPCYHRHRKLAAKRRCAACQQLGNIWPGTEVCGRCHRRARPRKPHKPPTPRRCVACGQLRIHHCFGRCYRCQATNPAYPIIYAARLAVRLQRAGQPPPSWLAGFAEHVAARRSPTAAAELLRRLGRLLRAGIIQPTAILAAASTRGIGGGPLARALESFFVDGHLLAPGVHAGQVARGKQARRVAEVPAALRPLVAGFDAAQLTTRERAASAGTRPRADRTLELNLAAVRDLARFLAANRPAITGWEQVQAADVEAYLATLGPATRARRLACLRGFFRFARSARAILADPTKQLTATAAFPFRGQVLDTARQRALYQRWTVQADRLRPHEPAVGLLMLLHGASVAELRRLRLDDVDLTAGCLRFASRPHPTPLDPATSDAIGRCLSHLVDRRNTNRYLLVNKCSLTAHGLVATGYLQRLLAQAGVTPRLLRATRLAHLAHAMDPILVAETFGVRHDAATRYLTDTVDDTRLAGLDAGRTHER